MNRRRIAESITAEVRRQREVVVPRAEVQDGVEVGAQRCDAGSATLDGTLGAECEAMVPLAGAADRGVLVETNAELQPLSGWRRRRSPAYP